MSQVKVTIVVNLEDEDGKGLTSQDVGQAKDDLEGAIRARIFGDGVFADHVMVDTYTIDSSYMA